MTLLDTGEDFINVDGQIVEAKALHIAEAIDNYDPTLRVICVDPMIADFAEAPFIIAQVCPDGVMRRIFEVWELDESVLHRIEAADTARHDVNAKIEWINAEARNSSAKRYKEKRLEMQEIAVGALRHKKSSFSYKDPSSGDFVTIHDHKPSERQRANI